jgi:hypothetical protein
MLQRVLNAMQFLWVLGQATVDGLTRWLCAFTRHHRTMSDVLRAERYMLTQELLRVSPAHPARDPCPTPHPHLLFSLCQAQCTGPIPAAETTPHALQGGEVHRGVLDQLYVSEVETALSAPQEARDGPSTASRQVEGPRGWA